MIRVQATPPPRRTVQFFDQLIPGLWRAWFNAAEWALREIDNDAGGDTVITSWFRSPAENLRVGGDPDSQHLVGLALDIVPGKPAILLAVAEASDKFEEAGFLVLPTRTHLHIQTFPAGDLRRFGVLDALNV